MKILIVSQYYWPENFRINELSNQLRKSGNEVTVLTGLPNYPEGEIYSEFLKKPKNFNVLNDIEIVRVPVIPRGSTKVQLLANYLSFTLSASFFGVIKLFKKDFDIIFVFQTSPVLVGIPSSVISAIKRIPQILWVLDLWPETLEAIGIIQRKWQLEIIRFFVNKIYARFSVILVQSKSFKKAIKKYHNNVVYFPAWAESEFFNSTAKPAKEISVRKNIFTLMFTGNIGEAQDFPSIVNTAKYLIEENFFNFRIIIIGNGSKKQWLIKEINLNNLNKYFDILDKFPLKTMPSFFAHADALLVSLKDKKAFNMTIPGKLQTYLSSGKPILGMINGEAALEIKNSKAGLVCDSGDYKGLAKLMLKLNKMSKKERMKMGENGISYCKKEFNKKSLIKKLENIMKANS